MSRIRRLLGAGAAVAVVAVVVGGPAAAAYPPGCEGPVTSVGNYYIQDRGVTEGSIWIYEESNGRAGLQLGGSAALSDDTACQEFEDVNPDPEITDLQPIPPDTLIF